MIYATIIYLKSAPAAVGFPWSNLIIAASTLLAAVLTVGLTGRSRRGQAADERLWLRKADTYVDLADFVIREATAVTLTHPRLQAGGIALPTPFDETSWWSMHARVAAFASPTMRAKYEDLLRARSAFSTAIARASEAQSFVDAAMQPDQTLTSERAEALRDRERCRDAAYNVCIEIRDLVGVELAANAA
jgi:hypothetical protein